MQKWKARISWNIYSPKIWESADQPIAMEIRFVPQVSLRRVVRPSIISWSTHFTFKIETELVELKDVTSQESSKRTPLINTCYRYPSQENKIPITLAMQCFTVLFVPDCCPYIQKRHWLRIKCQPMIMMVGGWNEAAGINFEEGRSRLFKLACTDPFFLLTPHEHRLFMTINLGIQHYYLSIFGNSTDMHPSSQSTAN